jgi:hypothetical protein
MIFCILDTREHLDSRSKERKKERERGRERQK